MSPKCLNGNLKKDSSIIIKLAVVLFFFSLNICCSKSIYSQQKSQPKVKDTTNLHSPKKAATLSAICPGLGQLYNEKYWKIPVIYAGAGVLTYFAVNNQKSYKKYKNAYGLRTDGDSTTIDNFPLYSDIGLLTLRDYYRKNLEITVILSAALYILNIVDASVDAHLYDFNVSDDLSMRLEPVIYNSGFNNKFNPGVKLTLSLK